MSDLGLQPYVTQQFGFLTERGFICTASDPYRVRFESKSVFVELVFDGDRSYELDLLVGRLGSKTEMENPFSLSEILRLRKSPEAEQFLLVQVTSSEVLASFIARMALRLRTFGSDLIAGEAVGFMELAEQRSRDARAYAFERDLRSARARAEAAWLKKDYATVVEALHPFREALTTSEMRRILFAESHR